MKTLGALVLLVAVAGCKSVHIEPQALQLDDKDLSSVEHHLVMLCVQVRPLGANLKLRGMLARSLASDELYSLPFFNNAILGSKALPYVVSGDTVEYLVFVDLPAGRYGLEQVGFAQFADSGAYTEVMRHTLEKPVQFEVGDGVTYLGRLALAIGNLSVADTVVSQNPVSLRQEYNKYAGSIAITIATDPAEDIQKAKRRYPALAQHEIQLGSMSFAP